MGTDLECILIPADDWQHRPDEGNAHRDTGNDDTLGHLSSKRTFSSRRAMDRTYRDVFGVEGLDDDVAATEADGAEKVRARATVEKRHHGFEQAASTTEEPMAVDRRRARQRNDTQRCRETDRRDEHDEDILWTAQS